MKIPCRRFLHLAAGATALPVDIALRLGADLSDSVGANHRRLCPWQRTIRSEALPDLPTLGSFLPGYEASTISGLSAPKNTPAEIVDRLNKEVDAALATPKMKARLADLGSSLPGSPADFGKL